MVGVERSLLFYSINLEHLLWCPQKGSCIEYRNTMARLRVSLLVLMLVAGAWGQPAVSDGEDGMMALTEDALLLNSGEKRRVLVNGVDILARMESNDALIQAQAAIITKLNTTVVAQAASTIVDSKISSLPFPCPPTSPPSVIFSCTGPMSHVNSTCLLVRTKRWQVR